MHRILAKKWFLYISAVNNCDRVFYIKLAGHSAVDPPPLPTVDTPI